MVVKRAAGRRWRQGMAWCLALGMVAAVWAQAPGTVAVRPAGATPGGGDAAGKSVPLSAHLRQDVARHRAMALAHESAARCLESGRGEAACSQELQQACKGLAIGKYCGMKHEH